VTEIEKALALLKCGATGTNLSKKSFENIIAQFELLLQEKTERMDPQSLTLEQLKGMNGEPVYCIDGCGNESWCLIDVDDDARPNGIDKDTGFWDGDFYNMTGDGKYGLHVMGWIAYKNKLEEFYV